MSSLKKNLLYNFILSASQVLLPLISIPYISRVLDPSGIGRVSFIDSFTYYFIGIAEFGIMVHGTRGIARLNDNREERGRFASELLFLHIITSLCTLILYLISVVLLWQKIQDIRLLLFSLSFLLVNAFACEWYFLGMEKFRYITFRSLITRLLALASIFLLVRSPEDYYLYYGIMVAAAIVILVWNLKTLAIEVPVSFDRLQWKKHIHFTHINYFISLVFGVTLLLDNVLLRLVSTATAVGLYALPAKIVRLSSALITDSLLVYFPRIVSLIHRNDRKGLQEVVLQNLQLILMLAVPLSAGIFLLAEELVLVIFGEKYLPAVVNLKILALFPLLKAYSLFLSKQLLTSFNKEKLFLYSLITGAVVFIPATLILSYFFADKGACIALIGVEFIVLVVNYYYSSKTTNGLMLFDTRSFFQAMLGSLLFVPIIYFIREITAGEALSVLLFAVPACFLTYLFIQSYVIRNTFMNGMRLSAIQYVKNLITR